MLKAYLLAPIEDDQERASANRVWKKTVSGLISWEPDPDAERDSTFVKAWLRAKYADTIRDRKAGASDKDWELIGTIFHRWMRDNAGRIGVGNDKQNRRVMTEEFPFFARAYQMILNASTTYTRGLEPIFYNAHNDFTWQATVLMASLRVDDDDKTVTRKLAATATYLDIWLMRRTVNYIRVGYSSVSYNMWTLCQGIRDKSLSELIDTLKRQASAVAAYVCPPGAFPAGADPETGPVTERLRVREIDDDEGRRLVRIIRRGRIGGDVAAGADGAAVGPGHGRAAIAKVAFTSEDRVRDVIRNFNADGFSSLYPSTRAAIREVHPRSGGRSRRSPSPSPSSMTCRFTWSLASWPISWWPRGWSMTSATRACACCSAPRASPFNG